MKIYVGIDLHSNNSFVAMVNEENKTIYKKRLTNDLMLLLEILKPYKLQKPKIIVVGCFFLPMLFLLVQSFVENFRKIRVVIGSR